MRVMTDKNVSGKGKSVHHEGDDGQKRVRERKKCPSKTMTDTYFI